MLVGKKFAQFSPVIILFIHYCLANKFSKTRLGISCRKRKDSMINKFGLQLFKQFTYCKTSWSL